MSLVLFLIYNISMLENLTKSKEKDLLACAMRDEKIRSVIQATALRYVKARSVVHAAVRITRPCAPVQLDTINALRVFHFASL